MNWPFYASLVVFSLMFQGFYSMMEMACVSFNKVRLHYYSSKGYRRAKWLSYLLSRPGLFFGTTLISVNSALQFGSESARQLYASIGLSPDWAPLTQVLLVLVFAELSPLFAARKHAEPVAMLGIPILYFTSRILLPVIWIIDGMCRGLNRLFGVRMASGLYLSRDELQKAVESRSEGGEDFDTALAQIFRLKTTRAKELMQPLEMVDMLAADTTVSDAKKMWKEWEPACLPLYDKTLCNIVGVVYPRMLLNVPLDAPVRGGAISPWFITETTPILDLLHQFRTNEQTLAIVLDLNGRAIGMLTLDAIIDEIFGSLNAGLADEQQVIIERTFSGDALIQEINITLGIQLPTEGIETMNDLILKLLGHPPAKGEIALCGRFELTVQETALLGAKTVLLRTQ